MFDQTELSQLRVGEASGNPPRPGRHHGVTFSLSLTGNFTSRAVET